MTLTLHSTFWEKNSNQIHFLVISDLHFQYKLQSNILTSGKINKSWDLANAEFWALSGQSAKKFFSSAQFWVVFAQLWKQALIEEFFTHLINIHYTTGNGDTALNERIGPGRQDAHNPAD